MDGKKSELTIKGNGYSIISNNKEGITVNAGQTLNVNNVKEYKGFTTAIINNGVLNIANVNFTSNGKDIENNANLNFSQYNTF